jgi:hypothetical protein
MRIISGSVWALAALLICSCGGSESDRSATSEFSKLVRGLKEAWPKWTYQLEMSMFASRVNGREVLHCRLVNTSSEPVELNMSELPWKTPQIFEMAALASDGTVTHRSPGIIQLEAAEVWASLAPGAALEGNLEVQYLPFPALPRGRDLALLWSYPVTLNHRREAVPVSGVTVLSRRAKL